ncbi:putative methyltransferase PMT12 [Bidens hawaiensis]|uniref:putative methyltransferase PMT12 n=1 Tax=Bidens hawaiensis TaxID=980011 RepID=UPI00404B4358
MNQIQVVPEIAFGYHTRAVLDVGCVVASFGANLTSRNVVTLSVAPKDMHEDQIQFALERCVPAMVAAFATRRLLYPGMGFCCLRYVDLKPCITPLPEDKSRANITTWLARTIDLMHLCEPFDTHPRTYDLLHAAAAGLLSVEQTRKAAHVCDSVTVMDELQETGKAMGWRVTLRYTAKGPHAHYRVLTCDKRLK